MKVLLDACVWGGAGAPLAAEGHDVRWVGEWPADPGDAAILTTAFEEGRVLVTLDKDFGELAVLHRMAHRGIIRLVDLPARHQGPACAGALVKFEAELETGAIVTVHEDRVRIRVGDQQNDPPKVDQG